LQDLGSFYGGSMNFAMFHRGFSGIAPFHANPTTHDIKKTWNENSIN
jgi:hypothetical protein